MPSETLVRQTFEKYGTIRLFLEAMSKTDTTDAGDDALMNFILVGVLSLPSATATTGLIYIKPPCPPISFKDFAQGLLDGAGEKKQ